MLEPLGTGAMGVVYAAYDPQLDRRVALKLLRPDARASADAQHRLLREARLMARLAHPSVVTVYDAGVWGDRVFIAMELVPGSTAAEYVSKAPRSWRETLTLFLQAGRGLAAAHAAGVVHRDFKPDNVLVSPDGRARVTDFGLAHSTGLTERPGGTPVYMAPEVLHGAPATPASDQYSFCVALSAALAKSANVPRAVSAALRRGSAQSPQERFPQFDDLLVVLERATRRTRRWVVTGGVAAALCVLALALTYSSRHAVDCTAGSRSTETFWNATTQGALGQRFEGLKSPQAQRDWEQVRRAMDVYTREWAQMSVAACEATYVEKTQPQRLLDVRLTCLEERFTRAKALVELLQTGDAEMLAAAPDAVARLDPVERCSRTGATSRMSMDSPPPAAAEEISKQRLELARLQARLDLGDPKGARPELEHLASQVRYSPLRARIKIELARASMRLNEFRKAQETCLDALLDATAARDDETALSAVTDGAWLVAHADGTPPKRWLELAETISARSELTKEREALMGRLRASIMFTDGRYRQGARELERVITYDQTRTDIDPRTLETDLQHRSVLLIHAGEPELAATEERTLLELRTRHYGPEQPIGRGISYVARGRAAHGWAMERGRTEQSLGARAPQIVEGNGPELLLAGARQPLCDARLPGQE
jgi:tRNA A-37 threonylcarbamoyl transferase component Bud32